MSASPSTFFVKDSTDIEMRTQQPISWKNEVNIAANTFLEVICLGLGLSPRKLGMKGPSHPDTDVSFHEEHVFAVREEPNLHLKLQQPDVPMERCDTDPLLMWQIFLRIITVSYIS